MYSYGEMKSMRSTISILAFLLAITANGQSDVTQSEPLRFTYKIIGEDSLHLYVFSATNRKGANPGMLIYHGGGWNIGDPTWGFHRAKTFSNKGVCAIAVQYRLSDQKEITPIDAIADARDAILWVRRNAKKLQIKSDSIIAYGWSAGAHLAACTAVFPAYDSVSHTSSVPNALVLYSPALSVTRDKWFKQLLPPDVDPVHYSPAENISGKMPPSVIVVGKTDTVTPIHEAELFHQNMLKTNNTSILKIYDGVGHLFTPSNQPDNGMPNPDQKIEAQAIRDIEFFLQELGFLD